MNKVVSFLVAALAASSVLAGDFSGTATSGNLSVWRINQGTGQVSLCSFEGKINEPECYPWSKDEGRGNFKVIAGDDVLSTWRIDGITGSVSMCEYDDVAQPPICTPWSRSK
jgi:hypothetical protein